MCAARATPSSLNMHSLQGLSSVSNPGRDISEQIPRQAGDQHEAECPREQSSLPCLSWTLRGAFSSPVGQVYSGFLISLVFLWCHCENEVTSTTGVNSLKPHKGKGLKCFSPDSAGRGWPGTRNLEGHRQGPSQLGATSSPRGTAVPRFRGGGGNKPANPGGVYGTAALCRTGAGHRDGRTPTRPMTPVPRKGHTSPPTHARLRKKDTENLDVHKM